jgi:UDP-perosamine 4-acetyltransferase
MQVIGVGAGGHARVVLEVLLVDERWDPVALTDPRKELHGSNMLGVPVTGDDSLLPGYLADGIHHVFVGVGGVGDTAPRRRLAEHVTALGFETVAAIHPSAVVSRFAELGVGPTVLANAVVNAGARLGDHVIVNSGAIVEHDCRIGDYAHVATGARLASGADVGAGAHVGAGASVKQGVRIGAGSIVGLGAAVVADVPAGIVVVGVPARELSRGQVIDASGRARAW